MEQISPKLEETNGNRCRVCLESLGDTIFLFQTTCIKDETIAYWDILHSLSNIEQENNASLPQKICATCAKRAEASYEFKLSCEHADRLLQDELTANEIVRNLNNISQTLTGQKGNVLCLDVTPIPDESVKCSLCNDIYLHKDLKKHQLSKHPTLHIDLGDTSPQTPPKKRKGHIEPSTGEVERLAPPTMTKQNDQFPRHHKINNLILNMVIKDLQSLSIIDDVGFKELLFELEPFYKLPSRASFTQLLQQKCIAVTKRIRMILDNTDYITLIADTWTSTTNESYLSITGNFITQDWTFHSFLLDCSPFDSEAISNELLRVTTDWEIHQRVQAVTTDDKIKPLRFSGWAHIPCFARTFNAIIQNAVKEVEEIRIKVKRIVEYFHRNRQANCRLSAVQRQIKPEAEPLKLKNDVPTRWSSTFYMFGRMVQLQEPVTATIGLLHNPVELLSEDEWISLKEIRKILQPFENIAAELSAERWMALSKVIPLMRGSTSVLAKLQSTCTSLSSQKLIRSLLESMSIQFSNIETNTDLSKSSYLDPRFKEKSFGSREYLKAVRDMILQDVIALINSGDCQSSELFQADGAVASTSSTDTDSVWHDLDDSLRSESTAPATAAAEIYTYTKERQIDRREDPLDWWMRRESLYPRLSRLAKKYFSFSASAVPPKRIFSKAGQLITERRNCLTGKNVENILFLHSNRL